MKVLIIEDEKPAARRLEKLLREIEPGIEVLTVLESIEDSVNWLSHHSAPDLVFLDIHLADGDSFQIFKKITITAPIIFTTAYDEYALEAFKVNSIDYLLKPIDPEHLARSFRKLKSLKDSSTADYHLQKLLDGIRGFKKYRTRFLIRQKDKLLTIEDDHVAYFNAVDKVVLLVTFENRQFVMDEILETYEKETDPDKFFRVNRSFLVNRKAIKNMEVQYNGKIRIELLPSLKDDIFISREKAPMFKSWLEG